MKRRKGKRKPKQHLRQSAQVTVQAAGEELASPLEIEVAIETVVAAAEILEKTEEPANPEVIVADTKKSASDSAATATGADRRVHPRYAFAAAIEVAAADGGEKIKTRLRDLSQQGCYVDTDRPLPLGMTTDVHITKGANSVEARAMVVYNQPGKGMGLMFTHVEPGHLGTLNIWIAESRESLWLADNRRRSQRVLMKVPVRVAGKVGSGSFFEEETHTLTISPHGALILVAAAVYRGQRLTLTNVQTRAALDCVVVHIDSSVVGQTQVGMEFMLPNLTFWRVVFPPKDWTPRHPDAKSG